MKRKSIYKKNGAELEDYVVVEKFNNENPESLEQILYSNYLPIVKEMIMHNKGLTEKE